MDATRPRRILRKRHLSTPLCIARSALAMWETDSSLTDALLPHATPRVQPKRPRPVRVAVVVIAGISALVALRGLLTSQGGAELAFQRTETKQSAHIVTPSHFERLAHDPDEYDNEDEETQDEDDEPVDVAQQSVHQQHSSDGILGDGLTHSELLELTSSAPPSPFSRLRSRSTEAVYSMKRNAKRNRRQRRKRIVLLNRKRSEKRPATTGFEMPAVHLLPESSIIHNESFIVRNVLFDRTVSRDKGIIININDHTVAMGLSLVKELRCLGNHELIQVYHCLPAALSLMNKQLLVSQDDRLEVIDVCSDLINAGVFSEKRAAEFTNWWTKPLAMHHTRLLEPILLDADVFLLQNPAIVRDSECYKKNGTLFFYDNVHFRGRSRSARLQDPPILRMIGDKMNYSAFDLAPPQTPHNHLHGNRRKIAREVESSMVAIDKTRSGKAMDVLWWVVTQLRRAKPQLSLDDNEVFWLSYELGQRPYAFTPWGASVVGTHLNQTGGSHAEMLCGSLAQFVPSTSSEPQLLFVKGSQSMLDTNYQGVHSSSDDALFIVPRKPPTDTQPMGSAKIVHDECLPATGSTPVSGVFRRLLSRRRLHYKAVLSGQLALLDTCESPKDP